MNLRGIVAATLEADGFQVLLVVLMAHRLAETVVHTIVIL